MARSLRKAKLSRTQARKMGYKISTHLWQSCLDETERNVGGRPSKITPEIAIQLDAFLESISSTAANRMVYSSYNIPNGRRQLVPVQYLQDKLREAYRKFPARDEIGFYTFYRYVKKQKIFKKPRRASDLCDYCEFGYQLKTRIMDDAKILRLNIDADMSNYKDLLRQLKDSKQPSREHLSLIRKLSNYKGVEHHRSIAATQRAAYNRQRSDKQFLRDGLVIEVDFKQKVVLQNGPRQLNPDFYRAQSRSIIGFGIYFLHKNEVKCYRVDVVHELEPCASTVIKIFKFIREQKFFKLIDQPNYRFWCDSGTHFKCAELIYFLTEDLSSETVRNRAIATEINYFVERHGKNQCDPHFSRLSHFIKKAGMKKAQKTSQDIVDCLIQEQKASNKVRQKILKTSKILFHVFLYRDDNQLREKRTRVIEDLKSYYNVQYVRQNDGNFILQTSIFSDCLSMINLEGKYKDFVEKIPAARITRQTTSTNANQSSGESEDGSDESDAESDVNSPSSDCIRTLNDRYQRNQLIMRQATNPMGIDVDASSRDSYLSSNLTSDASSESESDSDETPPFCKIECKNCNAKCLPLATIRNARVFGQKKIQEELGKHEHSKSPKTLKGRKRQLKVEELREVLLKHYEFAHKRS